MTLFTLLILSTALFLHAGAEPPPATYPAAARLDKYRFNPSFAVAAFFLSLLSLLLWFLLLYVRYIRGQRRSISPDPSPEIIRLRSQFLGLDRSVIDSLPLIEYSSLKGAKDQVLECPVCLSRFEEVEVLRLLPRCNHAFHVRCIDRWLEKNSSCPICRSGVSREDAAVVERSNRWVFWNPLADDGEQEEVQRNEERERIRRTPRPNLNHKITLPKITFENRWSDASSSDLLFLKSEMIDAVSSNRFSPTANFYSSEVAIENVPSSSSEGRRSVSEITTVSRFGDMGKRYKECSSWGISNDEDRRRRVWLQIARKTIVWIANRERSQVHDLLV